MKKKMSGLIILLTKNLIIHRFLEQTWPLKTCRCDDPVHGAHCDPQNLTCVTTGACIVFVDQHGSQRWSCSTDESHKFLCSDDRVHCCFSDMCNADFHLSFAPPTTRPDGGKYPFIFSQWPRAQILEFNWPSFVSQWSGCDNLDHSPIKDGENFCSFQNSNSRVLLRNVFSFLTIIIFQIVLRKWKGQ